jgi:hypothetical protein
LFSGRYTNPTEAIIVPTSSAESKDRMTIPKTFFMVKVLFISCSPRQRVWFCWIHRPKNYGRSMEKQRVLVFSVVTDSKAYICFIPELSKIIQTSALKSPFVKSRGLFIPLPVFP